MGSYPDDLPAEIIDIEFLSDLHLTRKISAVFRRKGEDADYVVARDYHIKISYINDDLEHKEFSLTVPKGLITDLASVPKWGRWAVGKTGPHLEASIVHDWLYVAWQNENLQPEDDFKTFADNVFNTGMKISKVNYFQRYIAYQAVKWFGKGVFRGREEKLFIND